jgi:hypothetical protein
MDAIQRLQLAQQALGRVHFAGDADRLGARVHLGRRIDRDDAGQRACGNGIDAADARVRVRAANEVRDERALHLQIGGEAPVSAQQAIVLHALHRPADERRARRIVGERPARVGHVRSSEVCSYRRQSAQGIGLSFRPK